MRISPLRRAMFLAASLVLTASCRQAGEKPWSVGAADASTQRSTTLGEVIGGEGQYGSHVWLGIPFAAPPVGELRWRAPHAPTPWSPGPARPMLAFASACPQFPTAIGGDASAKAGEVTGDEDCLYLNVWSPKLTRDQVPQGTRRLPVMFWIHGGGNSIGTSSFYDGGHLATRGQVIVVSTQYRLGPLGWFRQRSLRAGASSAEQSGNFGTLDLIRALEWVRDNIGAFGGDPNNVTVFGESAGGLDTYSLLVAPSAKGLFHRAIVESGGLSQVTPDEAERFADEQPAGHKNSSNEVVSRLLQRDGRASDRISAKASINALPDAELAAYLRGKTAREVLLAYDSNRAIGMIDMPLVFRDGAVLPAQDWAERLAQPDGWNRVPVIVGTNHDESKLFLFLDPKRVWKLLGLFPRFVDEPRYLAAAEYLSRAWKLTGADAPAAAMRRSGASQVFVYRFDWHDEPTVMGTDLSKMLGAGHGLEIPFVFGHFNLGRLGSILFDNARKATREQLSNSMMSYWTEFAHTGAPDRGGSHDLLPWTAWDDSAPAAPKFVVLDLPASGGIRMSSEIESRDAIIAAVDADPRLPTQLDKCRLFHDLAGWTHGLSRQEYDRAGKNGCAQYPFAQYPWGSP